MSRYTALVDNKTKELAWGFDPPLEEYFVSLEHRVGDGDEDENTIWWVGSRMTLKEHPRIKPINRGGHMAYSNGKILEILEEYKDVVPKEHLNAIVADLPF